MIPNELRVILVSSWLKAACPVGELYADSREVRPERESVFFAYEGDTTDGRLFIEDAIQRGAKTILYEPANFVWNPEWDEVQHLPVSNLKALAGPIASAYYDNPSASFFVVAVTGTNGKTSCTQWLGAALSLLGRKTAVIGTLGAMTFENGTACDIEQTGYTTPDPVQLQRRLAALCGSGVSCLAIEASSIGIQEGRLNGMEIDAVLYTNLSRDHLDYHQDMASYAAIKRSLFDFPSVRYAVLNLDDEQGKAWAAQLKAHIKVTGYTLNNVREEGILVLSASDVRAQSAETLFSVDSFFGKNTVQTKTIGHFNTSNLLGVLGILLDYGIPWQKALDILPHLRPPQGRMQQLGGEGAPLVIVDYAHTPDALEKGLYALKPVASERKGELWCVFGCGGDRDAGKRAEMGKAAEIADHVVVTSDNPRTESPAQIMDDIIRGMRRAPQCIEDRASAISHAIRQAKPNDVIFLAGKGHETVQEIMGVHHPFVDAEHAARALGSLLKTEEMS